TFPLKSLRLYARNEYGNRSFDYPFFGDEGPEVHRRLLLRAAGSHCMCVPDWRDLPNSHLTDGYLQSLVRHRDIDSQGMVPIALFINGEYWGIHHIRDRLDEHYVEIAHGIAADQVTILESEPPLSDSSRPEWAPIFAILDS